MQPDLYTKSVLTVIAAALVALTVQHAVGPSLAQADQVQKVAICSPTDPNTCASLYPTVIGDPNNPTRLTLFATSVMDVRQPLWVTLQRPQP